MSDDSQSDQPKQKTPQGEEIPIPTREEFLRNLTKVTKKPKPSRVSRRDDAKKD